MRDSPSADGFPHWTLVPFPALVIAIAVLPFVAARLWQRRSVQCAVVGLCAVPVLALLFAQSRYVDLADAARSYASFVATLAALYVTSGGIRLAGDIEGKPATNVALVLLGAVLASFVGTTGASMLLIRPILAANKKREHKAHLVPFFIVAVANAGGLLTPLGDPPLLVGYIGGVPFFWTLRLLPAWLLYVGSSCAALYWVDRRAYAHESQDALVHERSELYPLHIQGKRSILLLLAIVVAALFPAGYREVAMVAIGATAYAWTPRSLHRANGFTFAPIVDVAIIFAGLFACLSPIQAALLSAAPLFPLHRSWQLFWASGLLSSVLDNAPTYKAFAALARGVSRAGPGLVAGVTPLKLAAISVGTVVMGATTYIGNGPNLMVKAIAEREGFPTPGFFRYALFAFIVMAPAHAVMTAIFALWER